MRSTSRWDGGGGLPFTGVARTHIPDVEHWKRQSFRFMSTHRDHFESVVWKEGDDDAPLNPQLFFPFVDPAVARILLAPTWTNQTEHEQSTGRYFVETKGDTDGKSSSCRFNVKLVDTKTSLDDAAKALRPEKDTDGHLCIIAPASIDDVVSLARQCDALLFSQSAHSMLSSPDWLCAAAPETEEHQKDQQPTMVTSRALWKWMQTLRAQPPHDTNNDTSWCTISLLLALSALESTIRSCYFIESNNLTNNPGSDTHAGKAPLLKTMLEQLSATASTANTTVAPVLISLLQTCLLPLGLNLRNLLWHGFIGASSGTPVDDGDTCPPLRPWLALIWIVWHQLEHQTLGMHDDTPRRTMTSSRSRLEPESSGPSAIAYDSTGGHSVLMDGRRGSDVHSSPLFRNCRGAVMSERRNSMILDLVVPRGAVLRRELCARTNHRTAPDAFTELVATHLLPSMHVPLWNFCVGQLIANNDTNKHTAIPVTTIAVVLTILLEHGLRLLWCDCNGRPYDTCANSGRLYVTLDGHGQRHKHDTILFPYISHHGNSSSVNLVPPMTGYYETNSSTDDQSSVKSYTKNALVSCLGGSAMALLVDMFVSGAGGPNIRAALAHGVWDSNIARELAYMTEPSLGEMEASESRWHLVDVLLVMLEKVAYSAACRSNTAKGNNLTRDGHQFPYRPVFSFGATTMDSCHGLRMALQQLAEVVQTVNAKMDRDDPPTEIPASNLSASSPVVSECLTLLIAKLGGSSLQSAESTELHGIWTSQHVWEEFEVNQMMEPLGATRLLLTEISSAAVSFAGYLRPSIDNLQNVDAAPTENGTGRQSYSSRERKTMKRIAGYGNYMMDFYTFAALVAILHLQVALNCPNDYFTLTINHTAINSSIEETKTPKLSKADLVKAVARTRMVVSTVSTLTVVNSQRAFKAVEQYSQGVIVRKITSQLRPSQAGQR